MPINGVTLRQPQSVMTGSSQLAPEQYLTATQKGAEPVD